MISSTEQWFDPWRELLSDQPWQSTLEAWWRQFSSQSEPVPSPVFEKIAAQSHSFFQLAEELAKLHTGSAGDGDPGGSIDRMFEELKRAMDAPSSNQSRNLFWQMPLANWQRMVSSMPGFFNLQPTEGGTQPAFNQGLGMDGLLSAPGLGYTRETEADLKKYARLSFDYLEAQRKYNAFFIGMSKESLDSMRRCLADGAEKGEEPPASVREFYDLWVDCSEAVYRARTMTEEYARLHGDMVNTLMTLKQHSTAIMDRFTGMMNMPTRKELDTMHHRAHLVRRTVRELRLEVRELRQREAEMSPELSELNARLAALSREKPKSGKKKPGGPGRPAATRTVRKVSASKTAGKKVKKHKARMKKK